MSNRCDDQADRLSQTMPGRAAPSLRATGALRRPVRRGLAAALAVLLFVAVAPAAHAKLAKPWLPTRVAEAETLRWQSLFADWRIREATRVPSEVYPDLYSPEEAAYWLRELALPSCVRVHRNIVDCTAEATVWDSRSGNGETATWRMRTRRSRDARVRGGRVTVSRLLGGDDWPDVTIRSTVVRD